MKRLNDLIDITDKLVYSNLLISGYFWEFYPELTGNYDKDMEIIKDNETE